MNIRTVAIPLVGAGGGTAVARLATLDSGRVDHAIRSVTAHETLGAHALRWEVAEFAAHVRGLVDIRLMVLGFTVAATLALASLLYLHWLRARRTPSQGLYAQVVQRRVTHARSLSQQGRLGIDVARETALSRDAVALLHHVACPDDLAGAGTSYRVHSA